MKRTEVRQGHIVNINSISGHCVPIFGEIPMSNVYAGSKHAVTAITEVLRQELNYLQNSKIKVSVSRKCFRIMTIFIILIWKSVSPGIVKTDITEVAGFPSHDTIYDGLPHLLPEDVSQAVLYILSTPPKVQVRK